MARPTKSRALAVWMNGERVGTWVTHPSAPDEFRYVPKWLVAKAARPISLSMPLRSVAYKGTVVQAYFDNLLPDSRKIRDRLQHRLGAASSSAFDLLAEIGRDCVGAIQLLPDDEPAPKVKTIQGTALTRKQIERHLTEMLSSTPGSADENEDLRISIAGAQEKTAFLNLKGRWMKPNGATPSTHIFKLPIGTGGGGIDLSTSVENEWLCSLIVRAYGIPVATCAMEQFGDHKVLVVERFDRRMSPDKSWILRLPQEDLCQATGTPRDHKYESDGGPGIRMIMDLLLGSSHASEDRADFFRTQVLYWMLCAIDGHAKNFSLRIETGGAYCLTPRYDVMSAYPVLGNSRAKLQSRRVKMAMAAEGTNRHYRWHTILPRHWEETAQRCGIRSAYESIIGDLVERTPDVVRTVSAQLPKTFPDSVATPILKGLGAASTRLAR
jgi:serine/threonine-protein kinase HipA